jgi:hypothetical protein
VTTIPALPYIEELLTSTASLISKLLLCITYIVIITLKSTDPLRSVALQYIMLVDHT